MSTSYTVAPTALWSWTNITSAGTPTVSAYSNGQVTKSGVLPADLSNFIGLPLNIGGPNGTPISNDMLLNFIRWAEDAIEAETGLLLCESWVASPPEITTGQALGAQLPSSQRMGVNYDIADAGYDFFYMRWIQEGWGYLSTRFKPIRVLGPSDANYSAIQNDAFIYPLLNEFFQIPPSWLVEDNDFGLIRVVPATNVQMLPLFAIQLAVMGFAQSIPGGIHLQYTAGLTPSDYSAKWSFVKQYVLAETAIQILTTMQASINWGATDLMVMVDLLKQETKYSPEGALIGPINAFTKIRDVLKARVNNYIVGPYIEGF